jgi:hypothetical protein
MEREGNAPAEAEEQPASAAARELVRVRGEPFGVSMTPASPERYLLALQRTVGNRRVNRLLRTGAPASRRTLSRFVGWEHQRLGDKGSAPTCNDPDPTKCSALPTMIEVAPGVKLTWGQVVALAGDEFETVDDLVRAASAASATGSGTDAERGRLRAAMLHDLGTRPASSGPIGIPPGIYDGGDAAKQAQEKTFQNLALHNLEHFPNGGAQQAWTRHHDSAMQEALRAGWSGAPARLQKAYLYEAFGEHFLTDCFSAGHIRTPRATIYDWYRQNFADRAIWGLEYWLLGQYISNPVIPSDQLQALLKMFDQILSAALAKVHDLFFALVAGAVSGTIHDYEGDVGVLVKVKILGIEQQFTTYGDDTLPGAVGRDPARTSGKAEQLAVAAIQAAKADVDGSYALGQQLAASGLAYDDKKGWDQYWNTFPYGKSAQQVLALVPQAVPGTAPWGGTTWQWGKFNRWMYDNVNTYAKGKISGLLSGVQKVVDDHLVDDNIAPEGQKPFNPHAAVTGQIKEFAADPVGTIGEMILWSPLDPALPGPKPTPPPEKPAVTK